MRIWIHTLNNSVTFQCKVRVKVLIFFSEFSNSEQVGGGGEGSRMRLCGVSECTVCEKVRVWRERGGYTIYIHNRKVSLCSKHSCVRVGGGTLGLITVVSGK